MQSFSWHGDGSLLATICKVCTMHTNNECVVIMRQHETLGVVLQDNREKKLRVFDPRANSSSGVSPRVPSLKEPLQ